MEGKEEIVHKLLQIEDQARLLTGELSNGLSKDRARLIIGLAGYLRTKIEMRWNQPASNQVEVPPQSRIVPVLRSGT